MVSGIEKFKEYFDGFTGQYAFIGGVACDILLGRMGTDFRATKDIDMVLLMEGMDTEFANAFIKFVNDGGYEHFDKGKGKEHFFRFSKPKDDTFPYMIELFSKRPEFLESVAANIGPVHISDDMISLSAILLDNEYYTLLKDGVIVVDGLSVLGLKHIVLFKMKAWLDLSERRAIGEKIDSKDIRKHKNDVFRLAAGFEPEDRLFISGQVRKDAEDFLLKIAQEVINLKKLDIRGINQAELMERIRRCYGL